MAKNDPISSTDKNPNTLQNHNACMIKNAQTSSRNSRGKYHQQWNTALFWMRYECNPVRSAFQSTYNQPLSPRYISHSFLTHPILKYLFSVSTFGGYHFKKQVACSLIDYSNFCEKVPYRS